MSAATTSIKARLTLFGVIVFALVLTLALNSWHSSKQLGEAQGQSGEAVLATRYLADAQNVMWQLRFGISQYLAVPKPEERKKIIEGSPKQFENLDKAIASYEQLTLTEEQKSALNDFKSVYKEYKDARPHWFELMEAGKIEEAADWRSKTILKSGAGSVKTLSRLIEVQEKHSHEIEAAGKQVMSASQRINLAVLLVTVAALVAMLWLTVRAITAPLEAMMDSAQKAISNNDFTKALPVSKVTEVALLSTSFTSLMEKLKSIVSETRGTVTEIQGISATLNQGSSQVTSASQRQTEATAAVAASVEELSIGIGETASQAEESENVVTQSLEESKHAMAVTQNVMADMGRIAQTIKSSSDNVLRLSESSGQISGIVNVIKEIADQTNLLALNAAIEAARAGESGRGFAVVADEVRKLAERTSSSTQEISRLVGTIQDQIGETVSIMQSADKQAAQSVEMATGANAALEQISRGNSEVAVRVQEIAQAIRAQSATVQDISRNVETIAQMTEENAAVAGQNSVTANDLSSHASRVHAMLEQYRT